MSGNDNVRQKIAREAAPFYKIPRDNPFSFLTF